jgi:hypothetical protein
LGLVFNKLKRGLRRCPGVLEIGGKHGHPQFTLVKAIRTKG